MSFCYVYILQSQTNPERFYTGLTEDLQDRLRRHNAGGASHTSKFKPWRIKTAVASANRDRNRDQALTFHPHGHKLSHVLRSPSTIMKATPRPLVVAPLVMLLCFSLRATAASSHTFAAFDVGPLTGGGPAFTKSLDVAGLPAAEYLFFRVTATHVSGAPPHDGWSSTLVMGLGDGVVVTYWPTNTATSGAMSADGTSSLVWSGMLSRNSYPGGSNLTVTIVDPYTDASGPYYSAVSNVVVTVYPAPTPKQTFAAFDVGPLTGGGPAFTKSLDVSGLPATENLFARVTATHVSGAPPHDGWSSTLVMGLGDGAAVTYWPTNTATSGAMSADGTSSLVWSGMLSRNSYPGGSNLTVTIVDPYTDASGPYYSAVSNVVVTLYPAFSSAFVPPAPQLTIFRLGGNAILQWPTNATGFALQATTNLGSPAVWIPVSPGAAVVNGQNTATSSIAGPQTFFRLAH